MTGSGVEADKQVVRDFIEAVWVRQDLAALDRFWTADCVNHAAPAGNNFGLAALRGYHEQFAAQFDAFSDIAVDVVQQVGEDDRVVTQLQTRARHTGDFAGVPATGKTVTLAAIRLDRLVHGIAEHWSVADVAGLLQQLQSWPPRCAVPPVPVHDRHAGRTPGRGSQRCGMPRSRLRTAMPARNVTEG